MKSLVEKYLLDRTKNISFIKIKENAELNLPGYEVPKGGLDIPIENSDLASEIKRGTAQRGISAAAMIRGIVSMMGIDSSFKNNGEYKKILLAMDSNIASYIEHMGVEKANEGKRFDALVCFRALMQIDEKNINGIYNYALLCQEIAFSYAQAKDESKKKEFMEESKNYFENLVKEYPGFSSGIYSLAFFKYENGEYQNARKMWEEAIEIGLDDDMADNALDMIQLCVEKEGIKEGIQLVLEGDPNSALDTLLPLANKHAGDWKLLFFIGLAYRQLGEVEEAMLYFKDILIFDKENVDAMIEMGLCNAMLGDMKASISYFEKALEVKGEDPEILSNLAMAHFNMGNMEKAREFIEKSVEIDPDDEITKACLLEIENHNC